MSSSLIQIWSVLGTIWQTLFVNWNIPLLNFSPATLIFGVLSFFVACKFIFGILNITSDGSQISADRSYYTASYLRRGQAREHVKKDRARFGH